MKKLIPLLLFITAQSLLFSQVSTVRQVFNYAVGDSFEYRYSTNDVVGCSAGYLLGVITSVNASNDTITYGYDSRQNNMGTCHTGAGSICPWGNQPCVSNGQFQIHNRTPCFLTFSVYGLMRTSVFITPAPINVQIPVTIPPVTTEENRTLYWPMNLTPSAKPM